PDVHTPRRSRCLQTFFAASRPFRYLQTFSLLPKLLATFRPPDLQTSRPPDLLTTPRLSRYFQTDLSTVASTHSRCLQTFSLPPPRPFPLRLPTFSPPLDLQPFSLLPGLLPASRSSRYL